MKKIIYILLPILLIFNSCSKDYTPSNYYPDEEDGIEAFFPDSIGIWGADINLDWINDSSKSITAIYGDTNISYQIVLLSNSTYGKKIIKKKFLPNFRGYRLKKKKSGFDYIAENKKDIILVWQNIDYVFRIQFNKEIEQMAIDSCYFVEYK